MNTWNNNAIQFPRLLAEISATQDLHLPTLASSMDLTEAQVTELLQRADKEWDDIQRGADMSIPLTVNLFDSSLRTRGDAEITLTVSQLSDIVSHAAQLAQASRAGKQTEDIGAELEEALVAAGVIWAV